MPSRDLRHRCIAAFVGLGLLAALALSLLPGESGAIGTGSREDEPSKAAAQIADTDVLLLDGDGDRLRRVAAPGEGPHQAEGNGKQQETDGAGDEIVIVVVDEATGDPVPNVEVAFLAVGFDWSGMSNEDRHFVNTNDREQAYRRFGGARRSDATGRLRFRFAQVLALACADANRYGELLLIKRTTNLTREHNLVLGADLTVRVRVVDTTGNPLPEFPLFVTPMAAGIPLPETYARLTADDGIAHLSHLHEWGRQHERPIDGIRVRLGLTGLPETPGLRIDFDQPPGETLELVAPPTGEVVIRVRDPDDRSTSHYDEIDLAPIGAAGDAWCEGGLPVANDTGAARFRYVTLGQRLVAECYDINYDFSDLTFLGPSSPGEVVEVVMRAEEPGAVLVGRLVDEDGHGIASTEFWLHFHGNSWYQNTEDDGSFWIQLDEDMIGTQLRNAIVQCVEKMRSTGRGAALPHELTIQTGRNDVGELVISQLPSLTTGEVLLDSVRTRAELSVERLAPGDGDEDWTRLRCCAIEWDEDDRFTVHGTRAPGRYRLVASLPEALPPTPVEFLLGQDAVRIELRRGSSLRAEIALDNAMLAADLTLILAAQQPTPLHSHALNWRRRSPLGRLVWHTDKKGGGRGAFEWRGLMPGTYRLEVRCPGAELPIATLTDLVAPPGAACDDPRLTPIDLHDAITRVVIRVMDENGAPYSDEAPRALVWSGDGQRTMAKSSYGSEQVLVGPIPMTFCVAAPGYEIERLVGIREDQTIVLRPLPEIALSLPAVDVPEGGQLRLHVMQAGAVDFSKQGLILNQRMRPKRDPLNIRHYEVLTTARVTRMRARPGATLRFEVWLYNENGRQAVELASPSSVSADPGGPPIEIRIAPESIHAAAAQK